MNRNALKAFATKAFVLAVTLIVIQTSGCAVSSSFSVQDEVDVRDAVQNYVKAWLSNDADAVMATLTDDIVLQPHHGVESVIGSEAVRAWWFPEGPPTVITAFGFIDILILAPVTFLYISCNYSLSTYYAVTFGFGLFFILFFFFLFLFLIFASFLVFHPPSHLLFLTCSQVVVDMFAIR